MGGREKLSWTRGSLPSPMIGEDPCSESNPPPCQNILVILMRSIHSFTAFVVYSFHVVPIVPMCIDI